MAQQSLLKAALMLGGALVCVQTVVTVLERNARPKQVDAAFYNEMHEVQSQGGSSYVVAAAPARGLTPTSYTPR
jgi:hypothetical protein